jgi:hypothetical protein
VTARAGCHLSALHDTLTKMRDLFDPRFFGLSCRLVARHPTMRPPRPLDLFDARAFSRRNSTGSTTRWSRILALALAERRARKAA